MDFIDQMDEQKIIHFRCLLSTGMTNTTYAPSITHIRTKTYACILSDTKFVAEKLSVKENTKNWGQEDETSLLTFNLVSF